MDEYTKLRDAMLTIMNMSDPAFNLLLVALENDTQDQFGGEVDDTLYTLLKEEKDLRDTDGFVCRTVEQLEHRGLFDGIPENPAHPLF